MAFCISAEDSLVLVNGLQFVALTRDSDEWRIAGDKIHRVPDPKPDPSKPIQPQPEPTEKPRILCGNISNSANFLCLADDLKQVTLWKRQEDKSWLCEKSSNQHKRTTSVIFKGDNLVILTDKFGDCYEIDFSMEDPKPKLLLGHLSMLLSCDISTDGKRLLTSDRDEKIRISRYPNCYNIEGYLLGHTEFVTCCKYVSRKGEGPNKDLIVSGSGDGTMKIWDLSSLNDKSKSCLLASVECYRDAGIEFKENEENNSTNGESKDSSDPKLNYPPAVLDVRCFEAEDGNVSIFVTLDRVDDYEELLLYTWTKGSLKFIKKLLITRCKFGYYIERDGKSIIEVEADEDNANTIMLDKQNLWEDGPDPGRQVIRDGQLRSLFQEKYTNKTLIEEFYKKIGYDNMKDYMEKKAKRMKV